MTKSWKFIPILILAGLTSSISADAQTPTITWGPVFVKELFVKNDNTTTIIQEYNFYANPQKLIQIVTPIWMKEKTCLVSEVSKDGREIACGSNQFTETFRTVVNCSGSFENDRAVLQFSKKTWNGINFFSITTFCIKFQL